MGVKAYLLQVFSPCKLFEVLQFQTATQEECEAEECSVRPATGGVRATVSGPASASGSGLANATASGQAKATGSDQWQLPKKSVKQGNQVSDQSLAEVPPEPLQVV